MNSKTIHSEMMKNDTPGFEMMSLTRKMEHALYKNKAYIPHQMVELWGANHLIAPPQCTIWYGMHISFFTVLI